MYRIEQRILTEQPTAAVRGKVAAAEIGSFVAHAYGTVAAHLERLGVRMTGMPYARYRDLGDDEYEVEAGFPVAAPIESEGEVEGCCLPGGLGVATWHTGSYDDLGLAYEALADWVERHDGVLRDEAWEVHYDDPNEQPDPRTWRTEVIQPFRHLR